MSTAKGWRLTDPVPGTWIEHLEEDTWPAWAEELLLKPDGPLTDLHGRPLYLWRRLIERTDLHGITKAVAMALAECCRNDRLGCWPGVERLSTTTSWSKRAVIAAIRELDHRGLVLVQQRRKGANRSDTNVYYPACPASYVWKAEIEAFEAERTTETADQVHVVHPGVHVVHPPGARGAPDQVHVVQGKALLESDIESDNEPREPASLRSDAFAHARGDPERTSQGQETAGEDQDQGLARDRPRRERPWGSPSPKGQGPAPRKCPVCGTPYIVDERNRLVKACDCPTPTSDAFLATYTRQPADEKRA
jgi:hypothetical protein